ncbi:MAG: S8 family serine peptidase [Velocimicrobium sp.]
MRSRKLLCGVLSLTLVFQLNSLCRVVQASGGANETPSHFVAESPINDYAENELLVTYKTDNGRVTNLPDDVKEDTISGTCSLFTVEDDASMSDAIWKIATDADVEYVEPNYSVDLLDTNDTYSNKQWAYYDTNSNINAMDAWALGNGKNKEVVVAIIDTGIDYQHADLSANMWENTDESYLSSYDNDGNEYPGDYYGWNFSDNDASICDYEFEDEHGQLVAVDMHGTHVAGIIDAVADNGKGIAGLASYANVKIMSLKVMGLRRSGAISDIIRAIDYAQDNGATICNLSLGTEAYSKTLYQAMQNSSMLFVCAAGNGDETTNEQGYDITNTPVYPASFDLNNIISVANVNSTGRLDNSSCYSSTDVDIAAPGTLIASCYVDEKHSETGLYVESTGTSMAAPFVTATAAMISSYYGDVSISNIKQMILGGSKKVDALASKVAKGAYLDVYGAMTYQGLQAGVTTSIKDISKSNNKNYVIKVTNPLAEDLTLLYAKGEKDISYFEDGEKGATLVLTNQKAIIKVKKTSSYTVYIKDSQGNEAIYTDNVVVPKLTKLSVVWKKTLHADDTYRLKAKLSQSDVYAKVTYKSSNLKIAKVSSHGNVRAIKKGIAVITVTARYGSVTKTSTCKIVVK